MNAISKVISLGSGPPAVNRAAPLRILLWSQAAEGPGFLDQWSGRWKATQAVLCYSLRVGINLAAFLMGFGEALTTAFVGLAVLIVACVLWYLLHARWASLARRQLAG